MLEKSFTNLKRFIVCTPQLCNPATSENITTFDESAKRMIAALKIWPGHRGHSGANDCELAWQVELKKQRIQTHLWGTQEMESLNHCVQFAQGIKSQGHGLRNQP